MAFAAAADFSRQALHAYVLGFQHPTLHKTMRFESPWPADFAALVEALRGLNERLEKYPFRSSRGEFWVLDAGHGRYGLDRPDSRGTS